MANQREKHQDSKLIDALGGTTKAAKFFQVEPPSVTGWRYAGIPDARMMYLRLARPDLFPDSETKH